MDTYFIVLSVQTGAAYSHLYYYLSLSLSCEVWNTVQRHDVIACHYFETWGKSEEQGFCPSPFISRYFRALCFWKSAFLLGRHNSAIGIFMA